jgi:HEPN domain-containing protein
MADSAAGHPVARMLLEAAVQDFAACSLLASGNGIGDAVVGFHAQQAVEKSLKAVLSANGIEFRRTHDLVTLLDLLQDNKIDPDGLDRVQTLTTVALVIEWAKTQLA